MALVVRVGHGAGALRADEVDGVACGLQVGEEALAVAVGAAAVDVAPGYGVAEGQDAQAGCCAGGEVVVGEGGGEGEDFGVVSRCVDVVCGMDGQKARIANGRANCCIILENMAG